MDINYQIIDATLASIYWKDINGVYLGCNKYMVEMAGLENRNQIIGKTDYDLPWKKQADKIREFDQLVINNNKTYKLEENPKIHNGITKSFLSSKTPLLNEAGKIIGIIGVSIDITDKKEVEQILELTERHLEKSLTFKERFLRNLSHETRNPLQAFVVSAEVLADKWDHIDDKQKYEAMLSIASSSRRLANFVNNTFDLSDFINQEAKLNLVRDDITELIEACVNSFNKSPLNNKNAHIVIKYPKKYSLVYDKQKIKQVIDHLLSNAVKWTEPNQVIDVEISKSFLPNSSISGLYCKIKNKGIQIPPNELNFIFEPFAESSNTASKACGVGLGLALCKEIIKAHRGEIWAENDSTIGVCFNLIIPNNLVETIQS
jgi:PAS domain S-box-containing protein